MTPEQEQRASEMFASGASERQVAAELGIGTGTANRLHKRLQAAQEAETSPEGGEAKPTPGEDAADVDQVLTDAERDGALAELGKIRATLVEQLETHQGRADASMRAVQDLEQERLSVLADGGDAVQLRQRIRDARGDLDDWATATSLLTQRLAEVDQHIAAWNLSKELAGLRAELDTALAEQAEVYARSGDRQRAAIEDVAAAARKFCAVITDERAVTERVTVLRAAVADRANRLGQPGPDAVLPVTTAITAPAAADAGPPLALARAIHAAHSGNVTIVARELGLVNGWLPPALPATEELERWRKACEEREKQLADLKAAQVSGPVEQPDVRLVPVGFDVDGVPVNRWGDRIVPRGSLPHPMDVYRHSVAGNYGSIFRTGY